MAAIEIKMPQLFSSNDEGKIARWLIREGQQIEAGDVIAEVETDEATVDIEAIDGGKIVRLLVPEGTAAVKVNTPIAVLDPDGVGERYRAPPPAAGRLMGTASAASPHQSPPSAQAPAGARPTDATGMNPVASQYAARSRTRLVGERPTMQGGSETRGAPASPGASPKTSYIRAENISAETDPVAGWLVVVKGPGRGGFRPVYVGMNSIGRDSSQRICLSFGDDTISREEHAYITYDEEQRRFYLQHGGKANLVRLGKSPVLVPTELKPNDMIRVGKTTLRFFGFCGPEFSWSDEVMDA